MIIVNTRMRGVSCATDSSSAKLLSKHYAATHEEPRTPAAFIVLLHFSAGGNNLRADSVLRAVLFL